MNLFQKHTVSICKIILLSIFIGLFSACKKVRYDIQDPVENYNILWNTLNNRYCYFEYKNINWDSLYYVYLPSVKAAKTQTELFDVFCTLMSHLKDGHVNLYSNFDIGRYWNWFYDYPKNFSEDVVSTNYLKRDYRISGALSYTKIGEEENIGYIRYANFASGFSANGLNQVFAYFENCRGLIIDVRQNGGGNLMNSKLLASRFAETSFTYGYVMHKTGKGHNEFSEPQPQILNPSSFTRWRKPVVLLTNRYSYSTTNDFASIMKQIDIVTLIGDKTGGGGGMPLSSELPNGWRFRYSAVPQLDEERKHTENGIDPDIKIDLDPLALQEGKDSMIEYAIDFLLQ